MSITDGAVHGVHDVRISGPQTQQWNLALMSDGYQQGELTTFVTDAQEFAAALVEIEPFSTLLNEINVYRIDVSSTDSGADDLAHGTTRRTYFDAEFSTDPGLTRVLNINKQTARDVWETHAPWADACLVIVNTTGYGGSGDEVAAVVRGAECHRVALHELGHTAFGLEDEYEYLRGCNLIPPENRGSPPSGFANPNVTVATTAGEIPWGGMLTPLAPLPTTTNPDCTDCDPHSYFHLADVVGAFDGAGKYHCGVYRPQVGCLMRDQDMEFCVVCAKEISNKIMSA